MCAVYLVTGAAGHLGNNIVRKLVQRKQRVKAMVLPEDPLARFLPKGAEVVYGNVCEPASMEGFFETEGCDLVVIHAAGIVTIASKFSQTVHAVNVDGTRNVLQLCLRHHVKKLVYVSSVHAIPVLPKGQVMREVAQFDPGKVIGLYAQTKAEATALILDAAAYGLNISVVQPSGLCGPYDYGHGHLTQLLIDFYRGRLTAGIRGGYDFADVRDVAEGILSCCEYGRSGECYILSNRFFQLSELFELFHVVTGKPRVKTILPMWFAKGTAPLSELYYKLLKQPPLYTAYSLYTLSENAVFSHEKADRELGYSPRPFKDTIEDTFFWLKEQGRI